MPNINKIIQSKSEAVIVLLGSYEPLSYLLFFSVSHFLYRLNVNPLDCFH